MVVEGLSSALKKSLHFSPSIIFDNETFTEKEKNAIEVIIVKRRYHSIKHLESGVFFKDSITYHASFLISAGFPIDGSFKVRVQPSSDGYKIDVEMPKPKVVSVEMVDFNTVQERKSLVGMFSNTGISQVQKDLLLLSLKENASDIAVKEGLLDEVDEKTKQIVDSAIKVIETVVGGSCQTLALEYHQSGGNPKPQPSVSAENNPKPQVPATASAKKRGK